MKFNLKLIKKIQKQILTILFLIIPHFLNGSFGENYREKIGLKLG